MAMKLVAASVLSLLLVGCLLVVLSPTEVQTGSSIQDPTTSLSANGRTAIEEFEDIPEPVTAPLELRQAPDCVCDRFIAGVHKTTKGECKGDGAQTCKKQNRTKWLLAHPESVRPWGNKLYNTTPHVTCDGPYPDGKPVGDGSEECECTYGWGGLNCEIELLMTPQKGFEDPMPTCGFGIAFTGFTDFLPGTLIKSVNGTAKGGANGVVTTSGPFVNFIHEGTGAPTGFRGGDFNNGPGLQDLRMYQFPHARTSMAYGAPFAGDTAWEYWLTLGLPFGSAEDKAKAAGKWCIWTPGQERITDPLAYDWGLVQPVDIPDATNKITLFATCDNCPGHKGWLNTGYRKSEATWTSAIDSTHQVKNIATCCDKNNGAADYDFCPKQNGFLACEFHGCDYTTGGCQASRSVKPPTWNCKAPY